MSIRLIPAPLNLVFDLNKNNHEVFEREYQQLSEGDGDPISQWLKLAKARGETAESDPVLLNLMIEMHRKIDALERYIKEEPSKLLVLADEGMIERIGFHHFEVKTALFEEGEIYYGRVDMPVHPKREIGLFFKAESPQLAKIMKLHERDEKEWASYMTARERIMIREMRGEKSE